MATNTPDIVKNWNHPINLTENDDFYKLLSVVSRENKRLSLDVEKIYDNRFLSTATGKELEKLGMLVGVQRKNGEGNSKLRKRIFGEFAAQASDGTYKSVASLALSLLDADKSQVSMTTPPETVSKIIEIEIDGAVLDDNILSKSEIADLLNKSVSAGASVQLITTGTFAFAGDDSSLEGFDEGTWSVIA